MASSSNIYDLLNNDEQHSKKAAPKDGPGKPDKSDQRRSVPKQPHGVAAPTPDQREPHQRHRVDDRDRRGGRGGSRGGRGGRGGYHGIESDGQRRNFDRKQGEHHKHAPGEARKHGAVGEVDPSQFSGSSVQEFAAADASIVADANADQVGLDIPDVVAIEDPEDAKMTYDQYLASRNVPEDDVNRQTREVTNDGDFRAAKAFVREEESTFYDSVKSPNEDAGKKEKKEKKGPKKMSLFEMLGDIPAAAPASRGGRGGFDGQRGGRGGFDGQRGGRGGFQGERRGGYQGGEGARGGRGGFNGQRGGRGGAAPRGGRPAANVNLADQSAFPSL